MNYTQYQIVFQEVPDEISISFAITGCPLRCVGCHSPELRDPNLGNRLTPEVFRGILSKYKGMASCVLFYGGEWEEKSLVYLLEIAQGMGYNTCLYTGEEDVPNTLKKRLTYLKTGPYKKQCGSLSSENTNQKLIKVSNNMDLTYRFRRS